MRRSSVRAFSPKPAPGEQTESWCLRCANPYTFDLNNVPVVGCLKMTEYEIRVANASGFRYFTNDSTS